ncbi:hypothetical protein [Asticcacaulis taihuensis]|uniref:Uncharacterized protein n=1 Tax=Asticcacaulis taihuensis TaxID=260084 RepID=A0A1G4PSX8_9CAUL|nr:hypothetical protein [Asticcacaulis taihuensis]SCW35295.1 hypothetical protein SAMN02927928_0634 [Asticcacaulis taihuensis]
MLKAVLYIFAVMGLLVSPLHAQAAQRDCEGMTASMAMTAMSSNSMDCCDHEKSSKSPDKSCFNNCIAMCGLSVAFDVKPLASQPMLAIVQASFEDLTTSSVAEEPRLLIPPPKSLA